MHTTWGRRIAIVTILMATIACLEVSGSATASATPWDNAIVKQGARPSDGTSWLLIQGQRYWIPDGGTYQCLQASGVPGPYYLSDAELNSLPDQAGQRASCGAGNSPRGSFDDAQSAYANRLQVRGWATDPNVRTRSISIHLYVGGQAGTPGAQGFDLGPARSYRPDVNSAYPGDGNYHGFDATISTSKSGNQQVCAYAINVGPGANVLLACRNVYVLEPLTTASTAIVRQGARPSDGTSWLLIQGQRYWIPDGGTYQCLQASGVPGPYYLSDAELNSLPDQAGQRASCGAGNSPRGSFDDAQSAYANRLQVRGWATDPNVRTRSISIHLYVGGQAGTPGAQGFDLGPARSYRPDVNSAYPGDGNYHGFDATISTSKSGNQQVCAYAINVGPGANVLLACRNVFIKYGLANQQIVDIARSYALWSWGGQCKVWAGNVVNRALSANGINASVGGYFTPGGAYYGAYELAGGVLVDVKNAKPGDLIQTIRSDQKNLDYPSLVGLHTAIIVGLTSRLGVFNVRDSNSVGTRSHR
jgi:predicted small lipoprotein YifL